MAALTYDPTFLRPARFERILLSVADLLRGWALRRMLRRRVFDEVMERRRDAQANLRLLP